MTTPRENQIVDLMVFLGNPVVVLLHHQFGIFKFVKSKYWRVPTATFVGYSVGKNIASNILFALDNNGDKITIPNQTKVSALCGISLAACGAYLSIKE